MIFCIYMGGACMKIKVGVKLPVRKVWMELFKNYSGPFDVRVYRGSDVVYCKPGEVCLVEDMVKVTDIWIEDGVLVVECVAF